MLQQSVKTNSKNQQSQPELNPSSSTKMNVLFAKIVLHYQFIICLIYGFFIDLPVNRSMNDTAISYIMIALQFFLVVVGFGMLFSSVGKINFSSLGFTLLIVCLSVQSYFIANAFWSKSQIQQSSNTFETRDYPIYLSIYEDNLNLGGNLNQAIKCSLSIVVTFSMLIGRIGPFQILLISIFGTSAYQFARQINVRVNQHDFGSMKIFLFGGAFGLAISFILKGYQGDVTRKHANNSISKVTGTTSLIGLLIIWALFPVLSFDQKMLSFANYTAPLSVIYGIASSALISYAISFYDIGYRMIVLGSLAGGVAILSSSTYITNPVYAIIVGIVSAIIQYFLIKIVQNFQNRVGIYDSFGCLVFIVHGFLGSCWASINQAIVTSNSNDFNYRQISSYFQKAAVGNFVNGWITLAISISTGAVIGAILFCFNYFNAQDFFSDTPFWDNVQSQSIQKRQQKSSIIITPSQQKSNSKKKSRSNKLKQSQSQEIIKNDLDSQMRSQVKLQKLQSQVKIHNTRINKNSLL